MIHYYSDNWAVFSKKESWSIDLDEVKALIIMPVMAPISMWKAPWFPLSISYIKMD